MRNRFLFGMISTVCFDPRMKCSAGGCNQVKEDHSDDSE